MCFDLSERQCVADMIFSNALHRLRVLGSSSGRFIALDTGHLPSNYLRQQNYL